MSSAHLASVGGVTDANSPSQALLSIISYLQTVPNRRSVLRENSVSFCVALGIPIHSEDDNLGNILEMLLQQVMGPQFLESGPSHALLTTDQNLLIHPLPGQQSSQTLSSHQQSQGPVGFPLDPMVVAANPYATNVTGQPRSLHSLGKPPSSGTSSIRYTADQLVELAPNGKAGNTSTQTAASQPYCVAPELKHSSQCNDSSDIASLQSQLSVLATVVPPSLELTGRAKSSQETFVDLVGPTGGVGNASVLINCHQQQQQRTTPTLAPYGDAATANNQLNILQRSPNASTEPALTSPSVELLLSSSNSSSANNVCPMTSQEDVLAPLRSSSQQLIMHDQQLLGHNTVDVSAEECVWRKSPCSPHPSSSVLNQTVNTSTHVTTGSAKTNLQQQTTIPAAVTNTETEFSYSNTKQSISPNKDDESDENLNKRPEGIESPKILSRTISSSCITPKIHLCFENVLDGLTFDERVEFLKGLADCSTALSEIKTQLEVCRACGTVTARFFFQNDDFCLEDCTTLIAALSTPIMDHVKETILTFLKSCSPAFFLFFSVAVLRSCPFFTSMFTVTPPVRHQHCNKEDKKRQNFIISSKPEVQRLFNSSLPSQIEENGHSSIFQNDRISESHYSEDMEGDCNTSCYSDCAEGLPHDDELDTDDVCYDERQDCWSPIKKEGKGKRQLQNSNCVEDITPKATTVLHPSLCDQNSKRRRTTKLALTNDIHIRHCNPIQQECSPTASSKETTLQKDNNTAALSPPPFLQADDESISHTLDETLPQIPPHLYRNAPTRRAKLAAVATDTSNLADGESNEKSSPLRTRVGGGSAMGLNIAKPANSKDELLLQIPNHIVTKTGVVLPPSDSLLYLSKVVGVVWDKIHNSWVVNYTLLGRRYFQHFPAKKFGFLEGRQLAIELRLAKDREKSLVEGAVRGGGRRAQGPVWDSVSSRRRRRRKQGELLEENENTVRQNTASASPGDEGIDKADPLLSSSIEMANAKNSNGVLSSSTAISSLRSIKVDHSVTSNNVLSSVVPAETQQSHTCATENSFSTTTAASPSQNTPIRLDFSLGQSTQEANTSSCVMSSSPSGATDSCQNSNSLNHPPRIHQQLRMVHLGRQVIRSTTHHPLVHQHTVISSQQIPGHVSRA